jgi:hypothetical protein
MKKYILILSVALFSCKKNNEVKPTTQTVVPTPTYTDEGSVIFYTPQYPFGEYGSGVKIWINGIYIGKTSNSPSWLPSCGSTWGVNYKKGAGTYNFHAELNDCSDPTYNKVWDSTITIVQNACNVIKLTNQK